MIRHGWSMSLFHASQQWATMSSWLVNTRLESQFWGMNCQTFSAGLSSGERGGSGRSVMFRGTTRAFDMCQPAWSRTRIAWAAGSTAVLISSRWACMAAVSAKGMTSAAPLPSFGQMAPKMYAHFVRWSCGARGRVPRRAQRLVIRFFWPTRASSWNQTSMRLPRAWCCRTPATAAGKFF